MSTSEQALEALPPIKGFMFDLDGTLLLSDRSLGGYELLPGAVEVLSTLKVARYPVRRAHERQQLSAAGAGREAAQARPSGIDEQMLTPSSVTAAAHEEPQGEARADPRHARRRLRAHRSRHGKRVPRRAWR